MDCPLLSHNRLNPCRSTSDLMAHTIFSSDKYCKGIWFTLCPLFRQHHFKVTFFPETAAVSVTRRE
jgi:hypothetical protein